MFDFKRVEENDDGFTVELGVDDFVYTIFWCSWGIFACSGAPDERLPLDLIYFEPM